MTIWKILSGRQLRSWMTLAACILTLSACATTPPPEPAARAVAAPIEITSALPEGVDRAQLQRVLAHPPEDGSALSNPADWRFDTLAWVYQQANWRVRGYEERVDDGGTLQISLDAAPPPAPWVAPELPAATHSFWPDPTLRVIVDRAARRLYFLADDALVHTYPVAVGTSRFPTPLRTFTVEQIHHQPTWYPPPSVRRDHAQRGEPLPAVVPPGPGNPLGDIFVKLQDRIGIHGTNRPTSIGSAASYGCIRMHNDHIAELSAALRPGDRVKVAASLAPDQRPY